ncbi:Hypothetical predicted protein [Prunus dulcis]|uniref:Uncharacterized protein n=1 Tax=Prunus dulcis TaxID=3755 RepID=A0A5E4EA55_PRUDU|nr:hypothetical protein L3X38_040194 [Prunus dulcis]VVA10638.1 Hypothetical predicted protein [Prunus dulcis]
MQSQQDVSCIRTLSAQIEPSLSDLRSCSTHFSPFQVTVGVGQRGLNDAITQRGGFGTVDIELVHRVSKLGFSSSRDFNAFMTASLHMKVSRIDSV